MKKTVGRLGGLVLALGMLFGCVGALATQVQVADFLKNDFYAAYVEGAEPSYATSAAAMGDILYILTQRELVQWKPGMTEPETLIPFPQEEDPQPASTAPEGLDEFLVTEEQETQAAPPQEEGEAAPVADEALRDLAKLTRSGYLQLFADGNNLYGVAFDTGLVMKLVDETGKPAPQVQCTLDITDFTDQQEDYSYVPEVLDLLAMDGTLYVQSMDYERDGVSSLYRWDLQTGKKGKVLAKNQITSMSHYQEGLILCLLDIGGEAPGMSVATLDPASGKVTELLKLEQSYFSGIDYNPQNDTAYMVNSTVVYSLPGMRLPLQKSAYFPNAIWDNSNGLLASGYYYYAGYEMVSVRKLDLPGAAEGALTIYGSYVNEAHRAFSAEHPDIPTMLSTSTFQSLDEFTAGMASGQEAVDVLLMSTSYTPFDKLKGMGNAADLSGNPEIMAVANAMDPKLIASCQQDGKLVALPQDMEVYTIGYRPEALELLDLTVDDLPKNWMEMLAFVKDWQANYGEDNPGAGLFATDSAKRSLLGELVSQYAAYSKKTAGRIDFESPLFATLMAAFDAIDFTPMEWKGASEEELEEVWSRINLFQLGQGFAFQGGGTSGTTRPLTLAMDSGLEPVIPVSMSVMLVNPQTARMDQAILYVATSAKNYDETTSNIMLFPGHNDAVLNPRYELDLASWREELKESQKLLETADPENQANIQESIDHLEEFIQNADQNRYSVSAEEIAAFRTDIAPYLYVVGQTPLDIWDKNGNNELVSLMEQYGQGVIPVDRFMKDMSSQMQRMELENPNK